MWFFEDAEGYFMSLRDWFESTADDIRGVPVIGDYLAYPFDWIGWLFGSLSGAFGYASSWADITADRFVYIGNWIDWLYDDIRGFDDKIKEFLSWSDIRSRMEAYYKVLTDSYSAIVAGGKAAILGTYASLDTWLDAKKDYIEDLIVDRFEAILDRVFS